MWLGESTGNGGLRVQVTILTGGSIASVCSLQGSTFTKREMKMSLQRFTVKISLINPCKYPMQGLRLTRFFFFLLEIDVSRVSAESRLLGCKAIWSPDEI